MTTRWIIDPSHSGIHFSIRHMVFAKVRGAFTRWQGTLDFDEADPTRSRVEVRIEAASIDTHEPKRDAHLRSADFFDMEQHPELRFVSTAIEKTGDRCAVTGELSLHGVTRPITLDAEILGAGKDPWGNERMSLSATGSVNRKDFGLGWNQVLETGGVLVGETVEIAAEIEAVKEKAVAEAA
jgi:polyisoprenoid-binding protein YceI